MKNDPVEKLRELRSLVDDATTVDEIKTVHRAISRIIGKNPTLSIEKLSDALNVKIEKYRRGYRFHIYETLKEARPDLLDTQNLPEDLKAIEKELGESGVYLEKINGVIIPTEKTKYEVKESVGQVHHFQEIETYNRLKYSIEVLKEMNIRPLDCVFKYGDVEDTMYRKTSYVLIKIPQINKMIFTCDEESNRTFVIHTIYDEEKSTSAYKSEFKNDPLADNFIWKTDANKWKSHLRALLEKDTSKCVAAKTLINNTEYSNIKFSKEYFQNKDIVQADFDAFAKANGIDDLTKLSTSSKKMQNKPIIMDGRKLSWNAYLMNAAIKLFDLPKEKRNTRRKEALDMLKELIGVEVGAEKQPFTKEYFQDPKSVSHDFEIFAKNNGIDEIKNLNTSNARHKKAECKIGYEVSWLSYLSNAAFYSLENITKENAQNYKKEGLIKLMDLLGIKLKEKETIVNQSQKNKSRSIGARAKFKLILDDVEFEDKTTILKVLSAFAKEHNLELEDLTAHARKLKKAQITLSSGEKITYGTYLKKAAVHLNANNNQQAKKEEINSSEALKHLKEKINLKTKVSKFESGYFENSENIKHDLNAFIKTNKIEHEFYITSSSRQMPKKIICKNGKESTWSGYLTTACRRLYKDVNKQKDTLNKLKKTAEVLIFDKEYFENPEYIKHDLETFVRNNNLDGIESLTTSSKKMSTPAKCKVDVEIKWITYLTNATQCIFNLKTSRETYSKRKDTVNHLKTLAGLEVKEKKEFTKEYFQNSENIKHDLKNFATAMGKEIEEMNTSSSYSGIKADLKIGHSLGWSAYIRNAAKYIFALNDGSEINHHSTPALNKLKSLIGIEYEDRKSFSKEYFMNAENVKHDLKNYATAMDKEIEEMNTSSNYGSIKVNLKIGYSLTWPNYLRNAAKHIFTLNDESEIHRHRNPALEKLKEIASK